MQRCKSAKMQICLCPFCFASLRSLNVFLLRKKHHPIHYIIRCKNAKMQKCKNAFALRSAPNVLIISSLFFFEKKNIYFCSSFFLRLALFYNATLLLRALSPLIPFIAVYMTQIQRYMKYDAICVIFVFRSIQYIILLDAKMQKCQSAMMPFRFALLYSSKNPPKFHPLCAFAPLREINSLSATS